MLDTLSRETHREHADDVVVVLPEAQHRVVVHRPRSPQPALRRPSVAPPSERSATPGHEVTSATVSASSASTPSGAPAASQRAAAPRAAGQPSQSRQGATGLRITRRGRLVLLATVVTLLFVAFSIGRVMSNAAPGGAPKATTHTVVVAPGDTAWSLARAAMPHLDGRDAVDRLLALNHSDGRLQVGQTLVVPGS